jgi:hypothetical protein
MSIVSLLIIGGGFLVFKNLERSGQNKKMQPSSELPVVTMEIGKNSDNNGPKDWEKTLTETINGQNPADSGSQNAVSGNQSAPAIEPPSTLTEAMAQNFFSDFMSAKQTANETGKNKIGGSDQTNIANSFWDLLGNFKETGRLVYGKTDIKVSSSDDSASIKNYGNSLALIIKKYFDPLPKNEMEIYKRAVANQDENELKKLEPIANAYRNVTREALLLEVPPSYDVEHLTLINCFNAIAEELDIMQKTFDDPARALLAYGRFKQEAIVARFILRDLNTYFDWKKVTFGNGEPGEFFKIYLN